MRIVWMTKARYVWIGFAAAVLAACASQQGPAQKLISDIDNLVAASASEAAKYVPDQLADVQAKLDELKASFNKQDYAAVLAGAAGVRSAAQGLSGAAAAKKDELMKALNGQWTALAAALSDDTTAIQNRIDLLSKKSSKKPAAGIDLDAAKDRLSGDQSLWSKAQAAFATGNLGEAVTTANKLKAELEGLAASLQLDLSAPAPAPATPPKR